MEITVDQEGCVAAGQCVRTAPDIFDQSDEGIVVLLDANPPAEREDAVRTAMYLCPAQAITTRQCAQEE